MTIEKKLRHIWHEVFVKFNNKKLFQFADTCQNVVVSIDLDDKKPKSFLAKTRFKFHLSMCQACMNYYKFSQSLSKGMKTVKPKIQSPKSSELEALQKRLMAELANPKDKK